MSSRNESVKYILGSFCGYYRLSWFNRGSRLVAWDIHSTGCGVSWNRVHSRLRWLLGTQNEITFFCVVVVRVWKLIFIRKPFVPSTAPNFFVMSLREKNSLRISTFPYFYLTYKLSHTYLGKECAFDVAFFFRAQVEHTYVVIWEDPLLANTFQLHTHAESERIFVFHHIWLDEKCWK